MMVPEIPPAQVLASRPRVRAWALPVAGMTLLFGWFAIRVLVDAGSPSGYRGAHWPAATPWPYDSHGVTFALTAMTIEYAIAVALLVARSSLSIATRAMLGGLLYVAALLPSAFFAMHATAPYLDHLRFVALTAVFLLALAILYAAVRLVMSPYRP